MVDKRIVDYINTQLKAGYNIDVIRTALVQQGQNPAVVDECIKFIYQTNNVNTLNVNTPKINAINMINPQYQGFWKRFLAFFLDCLIIGIPSTLLQIGLVWATGLASLSYVIALASILFIIYMEGIKGGTPGKLILDMRVVNEKGAYIGFVNALLRYFGKILSGLILGIGYFMIGWDAKKQGLHDKIAKTYVVKL